MNKPEVGLQLIVFGRRNQDDLENVLREVKDAGYPAIEAGNLFRLLGENETKAMMAKYDLKQSAVHFGYRDYEDDSQLSEIVQYCKAMGIKNALCSGVADAATVEGYKSSSLVFMKAAQRLKEEGITFHYHNHDWEFRDIQGSTGMAVLSAETDPALVRFNIDVFWVTMAGLDPVSFIKTHASRAGYYHFKDGKRGDDGKVIFSELGTGVVDLRGCMRTAMEVGADWIVAEQDNTLLPPLESITISRQYMKSALGV
jgi:sugar phosphate isomerase/epimerase